MEPRRATPSDAAEVAALLHDFNVEFDTETPGPAVLTGRLENLLATEQTVALLAGGPAVGVALLTFRPTVWSVGPVVYLDELYVRPDLRGRRIGHGLLEAAIALARERGVRWFEIGVDEEDVDARRFYEAHGFATGTGPDARQFFYEREL